MASKEEKERTREVEVSGGLGAFLGQKDEQGNMYAIGYAGRSLKQNEKGYSAFLLEHAAAVYGLETFSHIIHGFPCILYCDHQPLTHLSNVHKKTLMRLQELILQQPVKLTYFPGESNTVADSLSRRNYEVAAVYSGPRQDS